MVVIVCGPAHSGKSVFFVTLKKELPQEGTHLFRACPDGEGTWSQLSDEVVAQELRHKGKFTSEFMEWVVSSIRAMKERVPLVLVDVGGIRSPENEVIFRECDAFVVLCRQDKAEERERWEHFGLELGLEMLASFNSSLEGEDWIDETAPVLRGLVTKLERGTRLESPAARALADALIEKSGVLGWTAANNKEKEGKKMATINLSQLAEQVGVVSVDREITDRATGEKRLVKSFNWSASDLPAACKAVGKYATEAEIVLDGGAPAFLYSALAHAVHPAPVYTADPKLAGGKLLIPDLPMDGAGNDILNWVVEEREDHTFVDFSIPGDIFDEDNLAKIVLPAVCPTKGLVVSGKGPIYIHAAVTRSYCHKVRWTATFAPQMAKEAGMSRPAVVTTRHHKTAPMVGNYVAC